MRSPLQGRQFLIKMQSTMPTNKTTDFTGQAFYVGLDVHKRSWSVTVRTLGLEVAHFSQAADPDQLVRHLYKRYPGGDFISAYEAGFCGTSAHYSLRKAGIQNIIINPADLPQTDKQKKNKNDYNDSRATARYLEAGILRGIHIMTDEQQELRALFRLREMKVRDVTRANNRLRSFMHYFSLRFPDHLHDRQYLSNAHLRWLGTVNPKTQQGLDALSQYIEDLVYQRKQLLGLTQKLKVAVLNKYPQYYTSGLSVPGIGSITAIGLLSEMGEPHRFKDPDQYCSWLGLAPAERSSGDTVYSVVTQTRCNKHLRPLLIEAAWVAIRKCPFLLAYYKKHAVKNNKKAIVKVAAKLALVTLAVMRNETTYDPAK
jgi:transposase